MCGIAGIVSLDFRTRIDEERLVRMRDALRHRGPDGEGLLVDGPVGLGHRRLAVIDVAGGHQPMGNDDGSVWIVFNGEIYNHAALRARLEARGYRYRTRSDTETILHLYEEEGERCVERLRGMFAFAVWDRGRGRLLLARDRLGIKPLYYALTPDELIFASEIKALLAAGLRPRLEPSVLPEYLASGFVSGEDTFLQGVRRLAPAHTLSWSPGGPLTPRRYWRIPPPAAGDAPVMRAEELRERLSEAVRSHLMSDVPLGVFLSGGWRPWSMGPCAASRSASRTATPTSCPTRGWRPAPPARSTARWWSRPRSSSARCRAWCGTRTSRSRSPPASRSTSCPSWPGGT
jgi:asparagine synthase (glutamine-hydrolysing)